MIYTNGECPQCLLEGNIIDLKLNTYDLWECKNCNLQLASDIVDAVIIRKRGKGKFLSQVKLGSQSINSAVLSGADIKTLVLSNNIFFKNETELKDYIDNEVLPKKSTSLAKESNFSSTYKHYYFKFGEKNSFFEKYHNLSNGFEKTNIVPLSIYFGKWKVEDYENTESEFYKEFDKNNPLSKKQIQAFMDCGTSELQKSVFWIFYKNKVYALQPFESIKNGDADDIDFAKSFPKAIPSKIILTKSKDSLPENFVTLNANQRYNRRTIALLDRKEEIVADFLIKPSNQQKLRINKEEAFEYLSPIQFETLIFLILHHNKIFVSTYRGGTLETIDFKIEVSEQSELPEFGEFGWKYIQIKMSNYQFKKLKLDENSYLIHLGNSDINNHVLGKDWIENQIKRKPAVQEWLKKSLEWYEIEGK